MHDETSDSVQVPLPPALEAAVFGVTRRLALQADLAAADRLLRELVGELVSAVSVLPIYSSNDGPFTLGSDDQLDVARDVLRMVAHTRRTFVEPHAVLVPISTGNETLAILHVRRTTSQPEFGTLEQVLLVGVARESASILHHLVVQHWQRRRERDADQGSLYRPDALEHHRTRGQEGVLAELSPAWVRRTYAVLVGAMAAGIAAMALVHVPTYSSGSGVVMFGGTPITAPMHGTVEAVYVRSSQHVRAGDVLVKLASAKENADLQQARTELEAAIHQYVFDATDETVKRSLVTAQVHVQRTEAALAERVVRASKDGIVSDVHVRTGAGVQFGDPILTISEPTADPEVWAFLPGSDRPRLRSGMSLQVDLVGFTKARESATIFEVGGDVIGAAEARRSLGAEVADTVRIKQDGSYVLVKARLSSRTFASERRRFRYHNGMPTNTEVRVANKAFLVTLLPALERYL